MNRRRLFAISFVLALAALTGCDELGNPESPSNQGEASLIRETQTPYGVLVTEVRYVSPQQAPSLLRALRDEVDHMDAVVPTNGTLVVVMVRLKNPRTLPSVLHLSTDFGYANGVAERRVWVARTSHRRFVALFGLRGVPVEVRTTTL